MTVKQELQELFNKSLRHVRRQGRPSMHENACVYRSPGGLSCAAAPFIRRYDKKMENTNFHGLATDTRFKSKLDRLAIKHDGFVMRLQNAHDEPARYPAGDFMSEYERHMAGIAYIEGLTVPPRIAMGAQTF